MVFHTVLLEPIKTKQLFLIILKLKFEVVLMEYKKRNILQIILVIFC
jgi:hypothetical protein